MVKIRLLQPLQKGLVFLPAGAVLEVTEARANWLWENEIGEKVIDMIDEVEHEEAEGPGTEEGDDDPEGSPGEGDDDENGDDDEEDGDKDDPKNDS